MKLSGLIRPRGVIRLQPEGEEKQALKLTLSDQCAAAAYNPLGNRNVDTDIFARVHSNARTVHPL